MSARRRPPAYPGPVAQGHYFEARPASRPRPRSLRVRLGDLEVELATDSGVFSAQRLDPGTAVLLEHLEPVPEGDLLDLGCGYGPLALALARRRPDATVWAVDVNERALELTRSNAGTLGLANIRVARPDEVPGAVRFGGIYSNPPIRIGKAALHQLLVDWLDRLLPAGRARLVVQKHLGSDSLARWLAEQSFPTTRLTSVGGYRILEVGRRAAAEQH